MNAQQHYKGINILSYFSELQPCHLICLIIFKVISFYTIRASWKMSSNLLVWNETLFSLSLMVTYGCGFEFPCYNQSLSIKVTLIYNIRTMASIISLTINVPRIFPNERMAKKIINAFWAYEYLKRQVNNTDEGD